MNEPNSIQNDENLNQTDDNIKIDEKEVISKGKLKFQEEMCIRDRCRLS